MHKSMTLRVYLRNYNIKYKDIHTIRNDSTLPDSSYLIYEIIHRYNHHKFYVDDTYIYYAVSSSAEVEVMVVKHLLCGNV